ncbi:hypothetical protein GIB67_001728 [Kingdonia uniflora]|uniref:Aminotransferase-like plant mobile domain-containing protein n=1 Tax=Kingdonia uniflora TaxID=39325 RepID=A0A7J7LN70_9MAGN|nr:hypothetical protein GIB67_001728 [Kingdonia uniflora]
MTPTLDDVEQLVGLPADGDATVFGGTWGFPTILEVFENNLLQDLNVFKYLKDGGAGNSLSLRKLKEYHAYKFEKVLSDGTAAAAKKMKGLTTRSVAHAYMLYVLGSFLFPMKKRTHVSARNLYLFAKDKVAKKWLWGSAVLADMYYNLGAAFRDDVRQFACCTMLLELAGIPKEMESDAYEHCTCWKWDVSVTDRYKDDDVKIHQRKPASVNEHGDTPVHQSQDIAEQYDASLQKLKEDIEKEYEANINLREALKEKTSECDMLKETIEQMKEEIELKRVVDKQCALEFVDLPRQLDAKCKEIESLKAVNAFLMDQIDLQLPPATPLAVLQSHQPVPDTTLTKTYEDLLGAHEDVNKKLIAKEDFRLKLVNAEERMKSLETDNSEWEVWRQALKKALASEGMGDMGDPTFEELFEQNERFFIIAQQGPKGDY